MLEMDVLAEAWYMWGCDKTSTRGRLLPVKTVFSWKTNLCWTEQTLPQVSWPSCGLKPTLKLLSSWCAPELVPLPEAAPSQSCRLTVSHAPSNGRGRTETVAVGYPGRYGAEQPGDETISAQLGRAKTRGV